jgi:hypothetical protein
MSGSPRANYYYLALPMGMHKECQKDISFLNTERYALLRDYQASGTVKLSDKELELIATLARSNYSSVDVGSERVWVENGRFSGFIANVCCREAQKS